MIKHNLYRREIGQTEFTTIATNLTNVTSYVDDTVVANTSYVYKLETFDSNKPIKVISVETRVMSDASSYNIITGGIESVVTIDDIDYKLHKFESSGTLNIVSLAKPIDILIVGGGGGGGVFGGGGGGGGGVGAIYDYIPSIGVHTITIGSGGGEQLDGAAGFNGNESSIKDPNDVKYIVASGGQGGQFGGGGQPGGASGNVIFDSTIISPQYSGGEGGSSGIYNGGGGAGGPGGSQSPTSAGIGKQITGFGHDELYFGAGGGAGSRYGSAIENYGGGFNTGGIGRNGEGGTPSTKGMTNGGGGGGGSWGGYSGTNGGGSGLVVIRYRL